MTQHPEHQPTSPSEPARAPDSAARAHARRIDCGGAPRTDAPVAFGALEAHPGRVPRPVEPVGAGAGRRVSGR